MGYVYEGKYEKRICSSFSMQFILYGAAANENIPAKLHPSHLWLTVWLLICSWTCYNQSSASRAGGKTTAGPMNDPDSPNFKITPEDFKWRMKSVYIEL